ncbi:sugar phosphate nucleotidyltransferase [Chloroflexota bacterium]
MQVVILAGGQATRLGDLAKNQPKSMLSINGKPFLEYQLELLRKQKISDIVICTGYLGQQIERYYANGRRFGVDIKYSAENVPLGTAGALKNAEGLLNDSFFTMYGDSYLFMNFSNVMSYFKSRNKLALMTVYKNYDLYDSSNVVIEGNLVKRYSKKKKSRDMVYIDYGVSIFKKEALDMVPENQFYSSEDLFVRLIEIEQLLAYEVKERFYEIGSPERLKEFEDYVKEAE